MPPIRCRTDFEKSVIVANFEKRGWLQSVNDMEWNVYWASVGNIKQWFNPDSGQRLGDDQIINHFPNHGELTRKDMMVKNVKRYRKEVEKEYALAGVVGEVEGVDPLDEIDFVPATYTLPADYSLFVEEFRRNTGATWIMKPARGAQGTGIFLINKLSQIKKWATGGRYPQGGAAAAAHTYVVSRYIAEPLLVSNKKFDLRLYVLVTSYRPLKAYIHKQGFARFCTSEYSSDVQDMDNAYMHLTNVAIQKHGEECENYEFCITDEKLCIKKHKNEEICIKNDEFCSYNANHGGKWSMANLMLYITSTRGATDSAMLAASIDTVIIHSLRACQNVMINDKHCFELYGYDVLIDANLKPWLIEVNVSKSHEFCIQNKELYTNNKELCNKNKEFSIKKDEFCRHLRASRRRLRPTG